MTDVSEISGFTAGPWEWTPERDVWGNNGPNLRNATMGRAWDEYWGPDGNGTGKRREDMPPSPVVLSAWGDDAWGVIVSEADARLIAAAPDMHAEIARLNELLRGIGANRYWEGRWRDADAVLKGMDEIVARLRREKADLVETLTELIEPEQFDAHPQDYMPVWHKARARLRSATETGDGQP